MGQKWNNAVTVGTQIDERLWRREEVGTDSGQRKRVSVGVQTNESFWRLRDEDEDLLPGLPDDITLNHIFPKLPWTSFYALSFVRRRWQQAIRSHKVHDARVRSHSTDTLVVMKVFDEEDTLVVMKVFDEECLILYSTTDGFYKLPGIPRRLRKGSRVLIPERCVSLDGKIYVLGGISRQNLSSGKSSRKVYVLDVAGQREWRQSASMKARRHEFGYGTKDGKIYVFGGIHYRKPVRGCEVYDPQQNSWSQIAPMQCWRPRRQVASVGEEFFVYGGYIFGSDEGESDSLVIEAYHPSKNEWRRVGEHPRGTVFMALGKLHVMTENTIDVYDHEKNIWSTLHSTNFGDDFESEEYFSRYEVVVVNDELLVASWCFGTLHLFRGKGLGGKNREIAFQEENPIYTSEATLPCTIQL